jgi:Tetratricopeptide repeat
MICFVVLLFMQTGCSLSGFRDGIDTIIGPDDPKAISHVSSHHNGKGLHYLSKGKLGKAETHFHKALNSDPRSAAAHNNIGNMMLSRHELYQAAWEFQRASELSPGSIEPLVNLGLVHEEGDRLDEAADYYRRSLELEPNNAFAIGNLTRVLVKLDADSAEIHGLLKHLIFVDSRADWLEWAEELIATRYRIDGRPRGLLQNQPMDDHRQPPQPHALLMPDTNQWLPEPISPSGVNLAPGYLPNGNESLDTLPVPIQSNPTPPALNPLRLPDGAYLPNAGPASGSFFTQGGGPSPNSNFQGVAPVAPTSLPNNASPGVRP